MLYKSPRACYTEPEAQSHVGGVQLSEILEVLMVVSFGISWPLSILKSYRARTAKGKSLPFLLFILFGYVCGVLSKILSGNITYVVVFYVLNLIMVSADLCLYFRNRRLDAKNGTISKEI